MDASTVMAEVADMGLTLSLASDGQSLDVCGDVAAGLPVHEVMGRVQRNKQAIVSLLRFPDSRLLTDDEKAAMDLTFTEFRHHHGHALAACNWDRKTVFGPLNITAIQTADEVPGVIALLMGGWQLGKITRERLLFRLGDIWVARGRNGVIEPTTVTRPTPLEADSSFCPKCRRSELLVFPPLTAIPSAQWLADVAEEVGACATCQAFLASTITMPEWFTATQQRQVGRAIEGLKWDAGVFDLLAGCKNSQKRPKRY